MYLHIKNIFTFAKTNNPFTYGAVRGGRTTVKEALFRAF